MHRTDLETKLFAIALALLKFLVDCLILWIVPILLPFMIKIKDEEALRAGICLTPMSLLLWVYAAAILTHFYGVAAVAAGSAIGYALMLREIEKNNVK